MLSLALALLGLAPTLLRPNAPLTHATHKAAIAMCDDATTQTETETTTTTTTQTNKKYNIEQIQPGQTLTGTVKSVQSYGAFIDIGATTDGLLHVSEMSDSFVKDANDLFKTGDAVEVRVKSVDLAKKQVALTKKAENSAPKPSRGPRRGKVDLSEFENFDEKEFISGSVRSIQSFGAFVSIKEGVDGLLHISQIKDGGVSSVEDALSEGQQVQVRIISLDKSSRRIGLSMRPYVELTEEEKEARKAGRRPRRSRDDGDDDAAFKLSDEEIEAMTLDFEKEPASVFGAAFARSEEIAQAKKEKRRYAPLQL